MNETKVYDLPTRLFHWLFAGTFVTAFFIAKVIDDESPYYSYHMLLGLILAGIVGLRIIWGFIGSRYARFSSFALRPMDLIHYLKQLLGEKPTRTLGHNPASSWAALVMMSLALGLAVTGYLMTSGGDKELFEDVHEVLANAFAVTAILHVAGVSFHMLRHRDSLGLAMVNGKKRSVDGQIGIERSYRGVALLFLVLVTALTLHLIKNYDSETQSLRLFGKSLQLGESEGKKHHTKSEKHHKSADHHDHDENRDDD